MSDIFSSIVTKIGRKIQKTDTAYKTKIKDFVNSRLRQVYERNFWDDLFRETQVTSVSGQPYMILPKNIGNVLYLADRSNDLLVKKVGVQNFVKRFISTLDSQGNIFQYSDFGHSPISTQLATSDTIRVVSSAAGDTTQTIYVRGYASGDELDETLSLNGTSNVDSANTYDAFAITNPRTGIIMVTKDADTTGVVTIKETISGTVLGTLGPRERSARFKIIRLNNTPNSAQTLYLGYKEPLRELINDGDVPAWECEGLLVDGGYVDCLVEQRQFNRAQIEESKWEKRLTASMLSESRDNEEDSQSIPEVSQSTMPIDQTRTF